MAARKSSMSDVDARTFSPRRPITNRVRDERTADLINARRERERVRRFAGKSGRRVHFRANPNERAREMETRETRSRPRA